MTNYAVREVRKIADEPCPFDGLPADGPEMAMWNRITRLAKVLAGDHELAPSLFSDNLVQWGGAPKIVDGPIAFHDAMIRARARRDKLMIHFFSDSADERATEEFCLRAIVRAALGLPDE